MVISLVHVVCFFLTAQSPHLYCAEVRVEKLNKNLNRKILARIQRYITLKVAPTYRTVSDPAILVIVGIFSIDILTYVGAQIHPKI